MTTNAKITRRAKALQRLAEERKWMKEHGDTEAAYVQRYGSAADPEHYGDGGEAIYAADKAALDKAEALALEAIRDAHPSPRDTQKCRTEGHHVLTTRHTRSDCPAENPEPQWRYTGGLQMRREGK